jgi:hypothetical protein
MLELEPLAVRAAIQPSTIDEENRSVDVVFTTGAPVKRYDWRTGEYFIETLSMDPKHVRLERINSGGPVLDSHSGYSLGSLLGVVVDNSARMDKKQGTATLRFSRREDVDPVWADVRDRIARNVSVGYQVHKYEQTEGVNGGLPVRKAIDWEPFEISMVPMPADAGAQTRSGRRGHAPAKPANLFQSEVVVVRAADPVALSVEESQMNPGQPGAGGEQRSDFVAEPRPGAAAPAAAAAAAAEPTQTQRATTAERERVQGIMQAQRAARLPHSIAEQLIRDGVPLVTAQSRIFAELDRRDPNVPAATSAPNVQLGEDPLVHVRSGIENAILHRVSPTMFKLEEVGREYRGMTLLDIARTFLNARGVRTTGMSKMELAGAALGLSQRAGAVGYHTTSDFAFLLADVASKSLRRAYEEAPQTFVGTIGRRVTLPDFKPSNRLQLGEAPALLEIEEHGEYTRGTIGEGREQFQLATYGRIFGITRKALVNDDTDAFGRVTMLFGRSARNLESDLVWAQITGNPVMGDGNALFSAAHGNLQTDGDVISILSLSRGRQAIRLQTGLDGTTLLNLVPRFLIVPPSLETVAEQFTAQLTAQQAGMANPFSGKLQPLTEARLEANSSTAWYLAASTDQIDIVEYAFLEGEEGPQIETRIGFDVDGLEIKARHDFAAKAIDWRGIHKDPGELVS